MANPNQHTRGGDGKYVRSSETAARDARAATLRDQGWTYQQIADELGFTQRRSARDAVRRAISEVIQGPAEQLLNSHMERLETIFARCMEIAEEDHVLVSHGRVITDADGNPLPDHGPTLAAFREARNAMNDFRNMTGMNAATKIEHSGGVKYEIIGVDPQDLV